MIALAIGKKGSGKSTLLRRLVWRRVKASPQSTTFYHDPGCQVRGGVQFDSDRQALAHFERYGLPRLAVFRGVELESVARLALAVHDVALVADELDRACHGKTWVAPSVRRIVHEGRHERVDLFGTFRSTRNVNEDLLGQADYSFLLRHTVGSPYDLQTIRQRYGAGAVAAVTALEPMHFIAWRDE